MNDIEMITASEAKTYAISSARPLISALALKILKVSKEGCTMLCSYDVSSWTWIQQRIVEDFLREKGYVINKKTGSSWEISWREAN